MGYVENRQSAAQYGNGLEFITPLHFKEHSHFIFPPHFKNRLQKSPDSFGRPEALSADLYKHALWRTQNTHAYTHTQTAIHTNGVMASMLRNCLPAKKHQPSIWRQRPDAHNPRRRWSQPAFFMWKAAPQNSCFVNVKVHRCICRPAADNSEREKEKSVFWLFTKDASMQNWPWLI